MSKQKSILIVDDTQTNVETLMSLLEEKYDILAALSGEDALEILEEESVDLILLDIMMPGIDGYETCTRVKSNPKTQDIPVIFITAMSDEDSLERAYDVGGIDYITKPFKVKEVLSRISTQLSLQEKKQILQDIVSSKTKLIEELLNLGIELTSQKDFDILLEKIVDGCQNFTMADAVTIYLLDEDEKSLDFAIAHTSTLGIKMGGKGERIEWPPLKLYDDRGNENRNNVAAVCALESKMFDFSDVYEADEFDFSGARKFDEMNGYRTKSMIVVPMLDSENNIIGVLQLINKLTDDGEIVAFDKNDELIANSISSLGAVSIHNHKRVKNLEELLEAFI